MKQWLRDRRRRADRIENEIDEELSFHLEMRTRDNREAGMVPEEARRAAEVRFGRRDRIRRRGTKVRRSAAHQRAWRQLFDSTRQDLRHAFRGMRRAPGFTLTVVVTLALGIGANTAIFSVVDAMLLRPLPYPDPERLVLIVGPTASRALRDAWVELDVIEEAGVLSVRGVHLTGSGEPRRLSALTVGDGFFRALGVPAARGRTLVIDDHRPDAAPAFVITHRLWMSLFGGDPDAVGRTFRLDGRPFTLVGIMPPGFNFARYASRDVFAPIAHINPDMPGGMMVARAVPGATRERLQAAAQSFAEVVPLQLPAGLEVPPGEVEEMRDRWRRVRVDSLYESVVGDMARELWTLSGAVALLLLLACANVANLMLARASVRQQEIAVRQFLGAGRARLARLLLTESLVLAMAAGLLALIVATWAVPALAAMSPGYLRRAEEIVLDLRVFAFTGAASVLTGLFFGVAPVLSLGGQARSAAVRGGGGVRSRGLALRRALIVAEVALALILLVGAGLLARAFLRILPDSPGFDPTGKLVVELDPPEHVYGNASQRAELYRRLASELGRQPGIEAVASVNNLPIQRVAAMVEAQVDEPGSEAPRTGQVFYYPVSTNYLEVLGIPILKGRDLQEHDGLGPPVAVINETMARRFWPQDEALGRDLALRGYDRELRTFTVVGIAADPRMFWTSLDASAMAWVPWTHDPPGGMDFVLQVRDAPDRFAGPVREAVRRVDPDLPVLGLMPFESFLWDTVELPRYYMTLMTVFSGIGLVIAVVGFLGVLSYWVEQRFHEIGVRVTLGARPGQVVAMVLRQGALLVLLGVVLGIAGALGLVRFLESFLYGMDPLDPLAFAVTTALLVAVALLACWLPARRAARVDPLHVLRAD